MKFSIRAMTGLFISLSLVATALASSPAWAKEESDREIALDLKLRTAIKSSDLTAVQAAIKEGAKADHSALSSRDSPIHTAIKTVASSSPESKEKSQAVFNYLWSQVRPSKYIALSGFEPAFLSTAAEEGCWECFKRILKTPDVDPNGFRKEGKSIGGSNWRMGGDSGGVTPLMVMASAVGPEADEVWNLLLAHPKLNLKAEDEQGNTALHHAAAWGTPERVAVLLAKGLPLDGPSVKTGLTPLLAAVRTGNRAAVKFLLDRGASITLKNRNGDNAMCVLAPRRVDPDAIAIAKLLIDHGANPNESCGGPKAITENSTTNRTRLEQAVLIGNIEWVNLILSRADPKDANSMLWTALEVAEEAVLDCLKSASPAECAEADTMHAKIFALKNSASSRDAGPRAATPVLSKKSNTDHSQAIDSTPPTAGEAR